MTPFDYLKAINETKEDVMLTEQDEKKARIAAAIAQAKAKKAAAEQEKES